MTHSSYSNEKHWEKAKNNERLEFLGDAVLELVSSDFLFHKHEKMPEGEMTRTRASMVCEQALAYCAGEIHLGEYLRLGRGEESTGGRERSSVVSDALEALIGAIYLDGGFASAKEFIHRFILNDLENKQLFYDSKTILQELVQGMGKETLTYELLGGRRTGAQPDFMKPVRRWEAERSEEDRDVPRKQRNRWRHTGES